MAFFFNKAKVNFTLTFTKKRFFNKVDKGERMREAVVLPIKPVYAEKILNGTKKYEYRKTIFNDKVTRVYIYESAPVSKIVGAFSVKSIVTNSIAELWNETKEYSGISKEFYSNYFKGKKYGFAIEVDKVIKFDKPYTLSDLGLHYAPQSFVYVNSKEYSLV